jgi:protein-L-isoaspartate(D-aspartate) O-methyltransferase
MDEIHKRQRALVDQLKDQACITTSLVEQAFFTVPRHLFLPGEPLDKVYADRSIVVRRDAEGQWTSSSSQPAIMAIMLEQLDLQPGQRVLEIGTGTGFNAALIASIVGPGGAVVTVDLQADLVGHAQGCLCEAGYGWVQAVAGDGGYGHPDGAPYDRIILSVASSVIAPAWREQLAPGGKLVLPLALPGGQKSVAFERQGRELVSISAKGCGFMVLQGDFAPAPDKQVQVGPDPNLCLSFQGGRESPVTADRFAGWLSEPGQAWATGVTTTMGELAGSFFPWSALQGSQGQEGAATRAGLSARGDLADQDVIPALSGLGGEWKSINTFVLVETDGAAAMMRPPGQRPPLVDINNPHLQDPVPFEVYVRQLGTGTRAAERMVRSIQDWDRAGRPASRWHIRALPAETACTPGEGEFLLDREWTKLVIRYL